MEEARDGIAAAVATGSKLGPSPSERCRPELQIKLEMPHSPQVSKLRQDETSAPVSPSAKSKRASCADSKETRETADAFALQPLNINATTLRGENRATGKKSTPKESVSNVKEFVTKAVPQALGTVECHLRNYEIPAETVFGSSTEVWELRITDPRITYRGIAAFTNVNDARGGGLDSDGPQVADLKSNRLVVVAEKRTRGFMHKETCFIFTMADCRAYHQRIVEKASHMIGKLESNNLWGTEYAGYDLSANLKSQNHAIPLKKEFLNVKYECSLGNPRQLLVAIPKHCDDVAVKSNETEQKPPQLLWESDIPPAADMDLRCQVIPVFKQKKGPSLADASEDFNEEYCSCFHNRKPLWDENMQTHILDFHGRVTHASVKNFQLDVSKEKQDHVFVKYEEDEEGNCFTHATDPQVHQHKPIVQFGRSAAANPVTNVSEYSLDVQYPFSLLQAMQLALTSVEHKLVYS